MCCGVRRWKIERRPSKLASNGFFYLKPALVSLAMWNFGDSPVSCCLLLNLDVDGVKGQAWRQKNA